MSRRFPDAGNVVATEEISGAPTSWVEAWHSVPRLYEVTVEQKVKKCDEQNVPFGFYLLTCLCLTYHHAYFKEKERERKCLRYERFYVCAVFIFVLSILTLFICTSWAYEWLNLTPCALVPVQMLSCACDCLRECVRSCICYWACCARNCRFIQASILNVH